MRSPEINDGELRGQLANTGSPGKMAVKMECMCVLLNALKSAVRVIICAVSMDIVF